MTHNIQAITFDVGGTLIEPWPSVGHVYATVAAEHGMGGQNPSELNKRFMSAWRSLGCRAESREDWEAIVLATFKGMSPNDPESLFETLYTRFTEPDSWRVFEDVVPTLEALRLRNVPLGILSNWDDRLRTLLDRLGLTSFFQVIVISCEVGCRKPDKEIFQRTVQEFDLLPGQLLHVGDSHEHDWLGARKAGLQSVGVQRNAMRNDPDWIPGLTDLLLRL